MREERRYLTDDRDLPEDEQNELVVFQGGNSDWYIGVVPKGQGFMGKCVRVCTSGGAASARPGLPVAVSMLYGAMAVGGEGTIGEPGMRDSEFPCNEFMPGKPGAGHHADCQGDGHYLCKNCLRFHRDTQLVAGS